jgi:hypothetical protein
VRPLPWLPEQPIQIQIVISNEYQIPEIAEFLDLNESWLRETFNKSRLWERVCILKMEVSEIKYRDWQKWNHSKLVDL